ncbi:hypothetical protein MXB_2455 [Myxobolus squamalis]|nr:hypothetical protein MXB_2455 [Myxobolus squamalis]
MIYNKISQLEGKYNKRFYEKNKLLLIEGLEPIVDAFNCGAVLKNLYYIDEKELLSALFNRPNLEEFYASESSSNNLTIICDGMQDHN